MLEPKIDKAQIAYLLNPENDILTEFKAKAPGSFKHCEEVSSLCEKIGRVLQLDVDFLKIIGQYHDIGKMLAPMYFSENQAKDSNIHDTLAPEISAYFIISHVANSIAVLSTRVPNINNDIIRCISMHHGNSVLSLFHKLDKGEHEESMFRYPYAKPDNVYACILMIVDIVEAKIRSLKSVNQDIDVVKEIRTIIDDLTVSTALDELTIKQGRLITETLLSEYSAVDHKRVNYESITKENNV